MSIEDTKEIQLDVRSKQEINDVLVGVSGVGVEAPALLSFFPLFSILLHSIYFIVL